MAEERKFPIANALRDRKNVLLVGLAIQKAIRQWPKWDKRTILACGPGRVKSLAAPGAEQSVACFLGQHPGRVRGDQM